MKFSVFQMSRRGGREKNEDRMGYCYTRASGIFLLADGMGGHPEGEIAAQLALQTISAVYQKEAKPDIEDVAGFLTSAILTAHRQILRYAVDRGMMDTPRTTVVAAVMQRGMLTCVHCGDSRFYLVRDGELVVRSRDHSYIEQPLVGGGAAMNPAMRVNRNILFTCLGSPTKPVFDLTGPIPLQQGDRLMLCSDGLWGNLREEEIVRHLGQGSVEDSVPDLVELALERGGKQSDNVTLIAMEWETPDDNFEETRAAVSTDTISDGVFASTVQASLLDSDADDLDDAAIERSIAEINEAIRRSAARRH